MSTESGDNPEALMNEGEPVADRGDALGSGFGGSHVVTLPSGADSNPAPDLTRFGGAAPSPIQDEDAVRRWLHESVRSRLLTAWFQPIVQLDTRETVAYEALARGWMNEHYVPPSVFITMAEREGIIGEVGNAVIDYALSQFQRLPGENVGLAINFTIEQLLDPAVSEHLVSATSAVDIEPSRLFVEISEHLVLTGGHDAQQALHRLAETGIQIVIDDFTAQHLSLSSVAALPVSSIKIARRLVSTMVDHEPTQSLVRRICEVGKELDLTVAAVGVEQAEQVYALRGCGCERVQGFFTGRPGSIDDVAARR